MEWNGTLHRISRQDGSKETLPVAEVPQALERIAGHFAIDQAEVARMLNEGQTVKTSFAFYVIED